MNELEKIFLEDQALLQLAWKNFENVEQNPGYYKGDDWSVIFKPSKNLDGRIKSKTHFILNKVEMPWLLCLTLELIEIDESNTINISLTYEYTDLENNRIDIHGAGLNYFTNNVDRKEVKEVIDNVMDEMAKKYDIKFNTAENPKMILIHLLLRYLHNKDNEKILEMKGEE